MAQAELGLSAAQLFVLQELGKTPALSLNDLAERTDTDQSSVSVVVSRLVESGHVSRDRDPRDGRRLLLNLTKSGRSIIQRAPMAAQEHVLEALDRMPPDERKRFATTFDAPAQKQLGRLVLFIPALGGVIVGIMARYGSKAIRAHEIPEAMEQVLLNESRIPARVTFLKPLSAAISLGTGGPFGAEGPIIATGGALGSLIGQVLHTSASERKTLLAAGAAAGMAATFGSPVSAVLLAIELLLFEFRARSIVPVALASAAATAVRFLTVGTAPVFAMPQLARQTSEALAIYAAVGALIGWLSVYVTRAVYWIEGLIEHLPF